VCLDVFDNLIAFAFKEFSQLICLKMALGIVGKIIVHRCKQIFDFSHQTKIAQSLDN
jgi:hypothetical protein